MNRAERGMKKQFTELMNFEMRVLLLAQAYLYRSSTIYDLLQLKIRKKKTPVNNFEKSFYFFDLSFKFN